MNRLAQYRQRNRSNLRKQQIQQFKANVRNLMRRKEKIEGIKEKQCPLCLQNISMFSQNLNQHVKKYSLCIQHQQELIQTVLICIQRFSKTYRQFITTNQNDKMLTMQRRLHIFLQIFTEFDLLSNQNQSLWQQIKAGFNQNNPFIIKFMDCAYDYADYFYGQRIDQDRQFQLKTITKYCLIQIFCMFPCLFKNLLLQYPIGMLFDLASESKKIVMLKIIGQMYIESLQNQSMKILKLSLAAFHKQYVQKLVRISNMFVCKEIFQILVSNITVLIENQEDQDKKFILNCDQLIQKYQVYQSQKTNQLISKLKKQKLIYELDQYQMQIQERKKEMILF